MIGIKKEEINKDTIMLFIMSYEYSLNFMNIYKLYKISKKYFWTFLEICSPMIKMGVRKAAMMRDSVDHFLVCLKDPSKRFDTLTPREEQIFEIFKWFIIDSFADGEGCLHITQFKGVPAAKAYGKNELPVASSYETMLDSVDRIHYIKVGDNKFYKTSKLLYYLEKFEGDMDIRELNTLSVRDMVRKIQDGMERQEENEEKK